MSPPPSASVIVPTRRRPDQLGACLTALSELDYPRDRLEVIVVDDGGDLPRDRLGDRFGDRLELTLASNPGTGPAAARNAGATLASGELLVFTDDDCRPDPRWLSRLAQRFRERSDRAVGGHTVNALPGNPYSATSQLIIDAGYAHYNADQEDARFFTSNNLAVPAEGFRAVGGFDPSFTTSEDRDFCARWVASGRRMTYAPDALVGHGHRLSLRGFCRQHFAYGRGAFRFHRKRARGSLRGELDLSYYRKLARYPFERERGGRRLLLLLLLAVWHGANSAGFAWEWWSCRRRG